MRVSEWLEARPLLAESSLMHIGVSRVRLVVRASRSLKDKRQVLRSIVDKLRNGFNVSVAEAGDRDHWQTIELAVAAVGDEASHVKGVLDSISNALRGHPVAEFVAAESRVLSGDDLDMGYDSPLG